MSAAACQKCHKVFDKPFTLLLHIKKEHPELVGDKTIPERFKEEFGSD